MYLDLHLEMTESISSALGSTIAVTSSLAACHHCEKKNLNK